MNLQDGYHPEYIVGLTKEQKEKLAEWLKQPNGGLRLTPRLCFEAVQGGGILVRTQPYRSGQ